MGTSTADVTVPKFHLAQVWKARKTKEGKVDSMSSLAKEMQPSESRSKTIALDHWPGAGHIDSD